jgi:hypothetical protein
VPKKVTDSATLDVSAEFGGEDAAQVGLPHFKTLKTAKEGITVGGFPFPQIAFILRVDGGIHSYGLSGLGNVDFDKRRQYLSLDIGIPRDVQATAKQIANVVSDAIGAATGFLKRLDDRRLNDVDWPALESALFRFAEAYRKLAESLPDIAKPGQS